MQKDLVYFLMLFRLTKLSYYIIPSLSFIVYLYYFKDLKQVLFFRLARPLNLRPAFINNNNNNYKTS